ncbi:prolipoprotein diacylglyceryl transferase [Pseudooceanicola sediminis]|uniref:Phosphatidylglycerol--prolipoprotein diacylglyceryl transferase n=1 Tax=Pseudooceanicola sediminis TaxID=2211117 RepID=A0A399J189_9RHOB|nr:prolipoprotein diacylglyceryl transferase [Pseudooceanicola sediminis]KAA2315175.1 prolipoprotein diacylglyceryl transferase [Puniceibacterium sp. HSS470]RII39030.1 prolipoprotein diacylglyceryl transferase [Pseudooceanicola sediminis]|tara:strand:+ start:12774 stop:13673 length:900 start_codon:yes stop_codon:yes gene_type:complete
MKAAIPFPDISPEIFTLSLGGFSFSLRWYALAYLVGIVLGWLLARAAIDRARLWPANAAPMTRTQLDDFLTWLIVGVILGGRLGFVLFYQPEYYFAHPAEIPMIWQGGMAFHGGLIGVAIAITLFCYRQSIPLLPAFDMLALATPPGLLLGRIANFINAELWGRPTDAPWGVIFPGEAAQSCATAAAPCARHPSQLYEAGMEGLILGAILITLAFTTTILKRPGRLTGIFIAGYGVARFIVEFFRLADAQFITPTNPHGHVLQFSETAGLTMGQVLSLPMVLIGLALVAWSCRPRAATP